MPRDIVCDRLVDEHDAAAQGLFSEYKGHTFYFCSKECLREFVQDADRFGKDKPIDLYAGPFAEPANLPQPNPGRETT